jgi:hypothetical protein
MDGMSQDSHDRERAELEKALAVLSLDSPARKPLLDALEALNGREVEVRDDEEGDSRDLAAASSAPTQNITESLRKLSSGQKGLAGAVVALAVGALVYFGQTAVVPEVVDEERSFAAGALRSAGFDVRVQTRADGDVREGHVLEQSPAGGSRVRKGSEVALVVSELPRFTLNGTFTLISSTDGLANNCYGRGGYSDIKSGVSVTVRDGTSAILATGSLSDGQRSATGGRCTFTFRIPNIKQADFYSVEVGRRGSLSYSFAEMRSNNWSVAFSLG